MTKKIRVCRPGTQLSFYRLGALAIATGLFTFACSGDPDASESDDSEDARGLGGAEGIETPNEDETQESALGDGGTAGGAGTAGDDSMDDTPCVPEADRPDDDYADTNCDGIDGDKSRAIFVSPRGRADGAGTMEDPLLEISDGVLQAVEEEKDVYVCNGTYEAAVVVEGAVGIYGGYDCENGWARNEARALVQVSSGPALSMDGVENVEVVQVNFTAQSSSSPGGSSVAALILDSKEISLRRLKLESGDGGAGAPGKIGAASAPARALNGRAGFKPRVQNGGYGGASTGSVSCAVGRGDGGGQGGGGQSTKGGATGDGRSTVQGTSGGRATGSTAARRSGANGRDGKKGTAGSLAAESLGAFVGGLYQPQEGGGAGTWGTPALGGGGGAGGARRFVDVQYLAGGGGGSGGAGGCGGAPGTGGGAGGASFALVMSASDVALDEVILVTGSGGKGGAGTRGGKGQLGGRSGPGYGISSSQGGDGGTGGDGGNAGESAPGGGGPSIAVAVIEGNLPTLSEVVVRLGDGGQGGKAVAGADASAGSSAGALNFFSGAVADL